jgi:aspartate/methionine/tyrosine aminotransferase
MVLKSRALSENVQELLNQYTKMEETGEPFGTVVIAEMAQRMKEKGDDVILCAESIISSRTPERVIRETSRNLKRMATGQEAPFLGLPELRIAISERFRRLYGVNVDWENQVIVTSGSMQAEYYLMHTLLNPGDEVIVPVPTFFFDIPVKLARGKPVYVRLDKNKNYVHSEALFEKAITDKTKLITLCNPHNPTGRVLTKDELLSILELSEKYDVYIMHDQVYERMVYDGRDYVAIASLAKNHTDRIISISSFSKIFNMINYRLGYAIGPRHIIKGMEVIHAFSSMGIPSLLQKGAVAALEPEFEDKHIRTTIARLERYRNYAAKRFSEIDGINFRPPEGTNLLLIDISGTGMNSMEACKHILRESKVACAPGVAYHAEGFIRLSMGSQRTEEAIDRVASTIEKMMRKR